MQRQFCGISDDDREGREKRRRKTDRDLIELGKLKERVERFMQSVPEKWKVEPVLKNGKDVATDSSRGGEVDGV